MILSQHSSHIEPHFKESIYIRDLVFGFGDGINTSLGIVAGWAVAVAGRRPLLAKIALPTAVVISNPNNKVNLTLIIERWKIFWIKGFFIRY
jgi:hypothetical protein